MLLLWLKPHQSPVINSLLTKVGISGCAVQLMDDFIIRKTSSSEEYNNRLYQQYLKQNWFSTKTWENIVIPVTLHSGYSSKNLFYFDMEYINGKLFTDIFHLSSIKDLTLYSSILSKYLQKCQLETSIKLGEVKWELIKKLSHLTTSSRYSVFIDYIIREIGHIDFQCIKQTLCHGDLTFSNILFMNDKLCFLDFLDSYIESYVIDIIKLKQDLYYEWYLNFLPLDDVYRTRMRQIFQYLWRRLEDEHHEIMNTDAFHILDVVNYLRIEPYLTTEHEHAILDTTIRKTQIYEKFNRSNGGQIYSIS